MDFPAHQVRDRRVNEAMALNRGFAGERSGDDVDGKMAAFSRPGVTGVSSAVVRDGQVLGFQRGPQPLLDQGYPGAHAGSALRNG